MIDKKIIYGGAVILGALGIYLITKNKSSQTPIIEDETIIDETEPAPAVLDSNLVLQLGSRGQEVATLQKLMSISADGVFGSQTESRLFQLKGVKKVSINQYRLLPTINTTSLSIGTRVMANSGTNTATKLYTAIQKADGSFYTNNEVAESVNYGNEIGTIKGVDATKNWYLILRPEFFTDTYYYVKASEVKKI